jgi:MFS family permease
VWNQLESLFYTSKKWLYYLLPSSISADGLHIVVPLYILFLRGTIVEVGISTAIIYGFSAIGSIFWGKIIDKFHVKRIILVISFLAITLSSILLFFASDIISVFLISSMIGFFVIAKNPITQILVMETVPNNQWSNLFARTSVISVSGSLVAFVVGSVWESFFDLRPYFLFCAAFSIFATILSISVKKSSFLERTTITHSVHGLRYIFSSFRFNFHLFFPKVPKSRDFKQLVILLKGKAKNELGLLLLANFFFYFGSNAFFTAFIPFLKANQFSNSSVFQVYLFQTATLLAAFYVVPRITSRIGEEKSAMIAYIPRVSGILVAALLVPITLDVQSFFTATIAGCLMIVAFSIFNTSNSIILFKTIPRGFEGTYLGTNSFMIGIGIFAGALTASYVTSAFGYNVLFFTAISMLCVSFYLFQLFLKNKLSHREI